MSTLCLTCHEDVAEDRISVQGFHGENPLASVNPCESCHTDHEGRDYDITGLLPDTFDHSETRFTLEGAHTRLVCDSCHIDDQQFREAPAECATCHEDQDIHAGALGQLCDSCHQSQSWQQLQEFDHDTTDFALEGEHVGVPCAGCHLGQQFEFPETGCITCHSLTDVHGGGYGDNCDGCHTVQGWEEVSFNHDETGYPLEGAHENTECVSCHEVDQLGNSTVSDSYFQSRSGTAVGGELRICLDCHADDDLHFGRNGEACESCHLTSRWQEVNFDHDIDTDYPLTDAHAEAECTQCHTGTLTDPLDRRCIACHLADDIHQDIGMETCESCHDGSKWTTASSFDHDFTSFPLLGMHQIAPCESCHLDSRMISTETDCVSCHATDDFHQRSVGEACGTCHTPNAWEIWQFDHSQQTEFILDGSHAGLSCDSCHFTDSAPADTPDQCGSCHLDDDIHRGQFGQSCEQCHNTSDFSEIILTGRRL
ncbi:MAG: cytochrome C [Gammaproteobacteria bacterium]|nr:cytochrome C [Pseudomonadales bacterium]